MRTGSTLFLRIALVLMVLAVAGIYLILFPLMIFDGGEDVQPMFIPILVGLYLPAIPFLFALRQAWQLLDLIDKNTAFSASSIQALKKIKFCAVTISTLFLLGMPYFVRVGHIDDAPGAVLLPLVIATASFVIATFAAVLQKLVESAIEMKSENDLTV